MDVISELRQYILDTVIKGSPQDDFDDNFDMIQSDIIDSLTLMELITHVEHRYQFEFAEDEIVPENFASIAQLDRIIRGKMARAAG
jgi:acyl carrier protein